MKEIRELLKGEKCLRDTEYIECVKDLLKDPKCQQMIEYIQGNIDLVISYCKEHMPQIKPLRPQASFLVWLDCRNLGLSHDELTDLFVHKAGLALNDGDMFSPGGNGFMRLNVGTSRSTLEKAMNQLFDILTR